MMLIMLTMLIWASSWQNQQNGMCAQRRLRPVWSESSLSAWRKLGSLATHWAHSKDSDQTGQMPRLIWVFAGCTCHYAGFVTRWLIFVTERNIKMVISESFCLCTVFDCGLHMGYISFNIKEKSQCCHHHRARLSLVCDLGDKVSQNWLTSPYFELREKFECIVHIEKSKILIKTSPWNPENSLS